MEKSIPSPLIESSTDLPYPNHAGMDTGGESFCDQEIMNHKVSEIHNCLPETAAVFGFHWGWHVQL